MQTLGISEESKKRKIMSRLRTRTRTEEVARNIGPQEALSDFTNQLQGDLLNSIMASAAEAVLVVDSAGRVKLANDAARSILGIQRSPARGIPWDRACTLLRRDSGAPYHSTQRPLDRALRGEPVDSEIFRVRRHSNANEIWVSCRVLPLENTAEGCHGAIMVARDITSLVIAEKRLLSNQQRLQSLIDRLPAIVWTTDCKLCFNSVQGMGLALLNQSPDKIVNRTMQEVFHTSDPKFKPVAHQLRALAGFPSSYEWRWRDRDYAVSVKPLIAHDKTIFGSVGIALDVTADRHNSRQLATARQIQKRLFPSTAPCLQGYEIAGRTCPAESVAGDYFDYISIENDVLGLVVGDVSGHGVGPAMLMAETRAYLRALAREGHRLHGILKKANDYLYRDTDPDKFVTLFLGELDPSRRQFRYASAGHETAYILDTAGEIKMSLGSTTTPLGLFASMSIESAKTIDLNSGDILVVLTDGVIDAARGEEDYFGRERALEVVRQHRLESAPQIVSSLHHAVHEFLGPFHQEDDLTALVVKVLDS